MSNQLPLATENKAKWSAIDRAAWVRVGALGDLLVGLASLMEMHEFFPTAKITVVGPALWTEILQPEQFPWVDAIAVIKRKETKAVIFTNRDGKWVASGETVSVREIFSKCGAVVNTNIDSARYGWEAFRAGTPIRVGSAPFGNSFLYTHASPFFGKDPLIHERDAALLILEFATPGALKHFRSVERNRRALDHWISSSRLIAKWRALGLPPARKSSGPAAEKLTGSRQGTYVLVNPTSSRREKAWPSEKFAEFLNETVEPLRAGDLKAIVIGSPAETDWLREVAGSEFQIVQPASIGELQEIVAGAKALLTNTSSMQFIAASQGCVCLTLMGRAKPEIWGPLGPNDRKVMGLPPEDLSSDIFLQEQEGYRSIPVSTVKREFLDLLGVL